MATLSVHKKGVISALVRGCWWNAKWAKNQMINENAEKNSIDAIDAKKLQKKSSLSSAWESCKSSLKMAAEIRVPIRNDAAENKVK